MKLKILSFILICLLFMQMQSEANNISSSEMEKMLYTMGTSYRSRENFVRTLKSYRIRTVIDVRTKPFSRYRQFTQEVMKAYLRDNNIHYIYLGNFLGGLVEGGFENYRKTKKYRKGLRKLKKIAGKTPSVIICSEYNPLNCHRLKIGEDMEKMGWQVMHIISHDFSSSTPDVKKYFQQKNKNRK